MKKQILFTSLALMVLTIMVSCKNENSSEPAKQPLDYTKAENWYKCPSDRPHKVDVFYLYPTSANPACQEMVAPVDEYMKTQVINNYLKGPEGLEDTANVFAPYYRQISAIGISKCSTPEDLTALDRANEPWADVKAALDEFFTKYNSGRPFILASHSQGSSMMKIVLSEYMTEHPDYLKRMVAAYTLGFRFNKEWVDANPHLKMASGEMDTGVIITFEVEGPDNGDNFAILGGTLSINPLNWKTDDTRADSSANLGGVKVTNGVQEPREVNADAARDIKKGSIVTTTVTEYLPGALGFGEKSLHLDDWALFYGNVKDNAQKRIAAYLEEQESR